MALIVQNKINIPKCLGKVENPKLWLATANEYYRYMADRTPFRTGALMSLTDIEVSEDNPLSEQQAINIAESSGNIQGHKLEAKIIYKAPYAKEINEGNFNFRKDYHPLAQRFWQYATWEAKKHKLIAFMQGWLQRYGEQK